MTNHGNQQAAITVGSGAGKLTDCEIVNNKGGGKS